MATSTSSQAATNIMLTINEKKTVSVDIYRPLRQYISSTYSEREAQSSEDDLQSVSQMRSDIARSSDSLTSRRDLLQSYYKSLCVMETRFPISSEKDHINTINFQWHDAFKHKQKASEPSIYLEKAAVLFNIGAVYSQIASTHERASVDGRRQASHAFIASAGVFAFLKDSVAQKASSGGSATVDLSVGCSAMLEKLMLAQAQECVFENTIAKGSTHSVCSKIAQQVSIFYEDTLAALSLAPLSQHIDKSWVVHVRLKKYLFHAEACYRCSLDLHEKEDIPEEIARLKIGIEAVSEVKKSSKGAPIQLLDAIGRLEGSLGRNLDKAVKENDRVYLMRVPPGSSLPPLPAVSLVKPMAMNEILDPSKEKLFSSLVPDSSAKALSRYTEMVDDIIRTQAEKLQQGSELTRVRLKEMDLPDTILALEGNSTLPSELKEEVEAVQIRGGPSGFEIELQQLKDLRKVNQELLLLTEELLEKEAQEDSQFRSQFGARWTRPQSNTLTKNLQDRLNKFASNLKQAADSDVRIERSVRDNLKFMLILDQNPIESAIPTLSRPILSLDPNEAMIVGNLKQSLRQLETLGAQRAVLEDMLKEMKRKDNILPKLMTSNSSYEDLFKREIAKYDPICEDILHNIEAQEQLLLQIQDQNNDFSVVFNLEDYKASLGKSYQQIRGAAAKFREIKDNLNEGLNFYVTLQDAVNNVKQQCGDFVTTRRMQCREMAEDVQRQLAGLHLQHPEPPHPTFYHRPEPPSRLGYAGAHPVSYLPLPRPPPNAYPGWPGPAYYHPPPPYPPNETGYYKQQ